MNPIGTRPVLAAVLPLALCLGTLSPHAPAQTRPPVLSPAEKGAVQACMQTLTARELPEIIRLVDEGLRARQIDVGERVSIMNDRDALSRRIKAAAQDGAITMDECRKMLDEAARFKASVTAMARPPRNLHECHSEFRKRMAALTHEMENSVKGTLETLEANWGIPLPGPKLGVETDVAKMKKAVDLHSLPKTCDEADLIPRQWERQIKARRDETAKSRQIGYAREQSEGCMRALAHERNSYLELARGYEPKLTPALERRVPDARGRWQRAVDYVNRTGVPERMPVVDGFAHPGACYQTREALRPAAREINVLRREVEAATR